MEQAGHLYSMRTVPSVILNVSQVLLISYMTKYAIKNFRRSKSRINPFRSHRVDQETIEPGDHIYTWTPGFIYSHHGICSDKGMVIHLTAAEKVISGSNSKPPNQCTTPGCGRQAPGSGVFTSCLNCFSGGTPLYHYKYEVGTFEFFSKLRGGTCTTAKSDPTEKVIERAKQLRDIRYESYNLIFNNCEGFALYCKTGLALRADDGSFVGISGQVTSWLVSPVVLLFFSTLARFSPNPLVAATVAYGVNLLTRHTYDIGVRRDARKVNVEDLA